MRVVVHNKTFKKKPTSIQVAQIQSSFLHQVNQDLDLATLSSYIEQGRSFWLASYIDMLNGPKLSNFQAADAMALDIDDNMTIEEAKSLCEQNNLDIALLYTTFSHSVYKDKFRIIFKLPFIIENSIVYNQVYKSIMALFANKSDANTKNGNRLWHATKPGNIIIENDVTLDLDNLLTLINTEGLFSLVNGVLILDKEALAALTPKPIQLRPNYVVTGTSEYVESFENGEFTYKDTYIILRSLLFVYRELGRIDDFIRLATEQRPEYNWAALVEQAQDQDGYYLTRAIYDDLGLLTTAQQHKQIIEKEVALEVDKILTLGPDNYIPSQMMDTYLNEVVEGKHLLLSTTGTGKTYSLLHALSKQSKWELNTILFALPNTANVMQIEKEYSHLPLQCYYEGSVKSEDPNRIHIATWDSIAKIKDNLDLIILDEAHALSLQENFRGRAVKRLELLISKTTTRIDITATPDTLYIPQYDTITKFTEPTRKPKVQFHIMDKEPYLHNVITQAHNDEAKIWAIKQDKSWLSAMQTRFKGMRSEIITADNKFDSTEFASIIEKGLITTDLLLTTDILSTGVNINNEGRVLIVIYGIKPIATLQQIVARFRRASSIKVFCIVGPDKDKDAKELMAKTLIYNKLKFKRNTVASYINNQIEIAQALGIHAHLKQLGDSLAGSQGLYKDVDMYFASHYRMEADAYLTQLAGYTLEDYKVHLGLLGFKVTTECVERSPLPIAEAKENRKVAKRLALCSIIDGKYREGADIAIVQEGERLVKAGYERNEAVATLLVTKTEKATLHSILNHQLHQSNYNIEPSMNKLAFTRFYALEFWQLKKTREEWYYWIQQNFATLYTGKPETLFKELTRGLIITKKKEVWSVTKDTKNEEKLAFKAGTKAKELDMGIDRREIWDYFTKIAKKMIK